MGTVVVKRVLKDRCCYHSVISVVVITVLVGLEVMAIM